MGEIRQEGGIQARYHPGYFLMKKLLLKLGRGGEGYLFNLSAVIGCNNHGPP